MGVKVRRLTRNVCVSTGGEGNQRANPKEEIPRVKRKECQNPSEKGKTRTPDEEKSYSCGDWRGGRNGFVKGGGWRSPEVGGRQKNGDGGFPLGGRGRKETQYAKQRTRL